MGCEITINDKLEIKGSSSKVFTMETFDEWLFENKTAITRALKRNNISLSNSKSPTFMVDLTPAEKRMADFEKFREQMRAKRSPVLGADDSEKVISLGVTVFFGEKGNKDDINSPVAKYNNLSKTAFIENQKVKKGKTAVEAEAEWNRIQKKRALKRLDGTILGALIQDRLTNSTKDLDAIRKKGSSDLKIAGLTFDQALERVKSKWDYIKIADNLKSQFINSYGKNFKIFTEFEVFSKEVSDPLKKAMQAVSSGVTALSGRIDILVQAEDGTLHSFDIKVSETPVEEWWTQNAQNPKYDEISAQQMANAIMAEQYGFRFGSINIIALNEELKSDGEIVSTKSEGVKTFGFTNRYATFLYQHLPVHNVADSKSVNKLSALMEEVYPGIGLDTAAQTRQISADFIMKHKAKERSDKKWHLLPDVMFQEWKPYLKSGNIVFDTREQMEKFVKEEYVPKMNLEYSRELLGFANDLTRIAKENKALPVKIEMLKESARGISKDKEIQNFIVNKFQKFVTSNWDLLSDEDNRLAQYGIFIFQKGKFIEIIMMDKTDLGAIVELGTARNTTVLGNLKNDLSKGADDTVVLKSLRGNLMLMKAMAYVSQNPELFNHKKIQAVRAINLRWGLEIDENNDKLIQNWNLFTDLYNIKNRGVANKTKLKPLGNNLFLSGASAYVQRADDLVNMLSDKTINFKGHNENIENSVDDTEDEILKYMRNLVANNNNIIQSKNWIGEYSLQKEAYLLLHKALLAVRGWSISTETDQGPFFSDRVFIAGTESLSPAESPSATIRIFNQIETTYEHKIRDLFTLTIRPWQMQMKKVYDENGIDNLWGNERAMFRNCFEKDDNGEISQDFTLIPPDENEYLNNRPELKKLVEMFLEIINEERFPNESERENLKEIRGSMYYQVPLTETGFKSQVVQDGFWNALKRKASNIFTEVQNFAYGAPMSSLQIKRYQDLDKQEVYDPYLDVSEEAQKSRDQFLSGESIEVDNKKTKKYGVGSFEVDLDIVFLKAMASVVRRRASREYMPLFTALRMILAYNGSQNGMETPEISEALNKFITSTVFSQTIIKPSNQTIYHILGFLRNVTSIATLALNTVSFFRENLSSALRTSISLVNDKFMAGKFNADDYLEQMVKIIYEGKDNSDVCSMYMQMNLKFGLANVSSEQLAKASKSNFLNPSNWEQELLFETTTMPDFIHRNALLWAFLKKRGSAYAYVKDEDGVVRYYMNKDKAYEIFLKYKDNVDAIPDRKTKEAFIMQRTMYEAALNSWNKHYGYNLNYGDALPEAITLEEANAIRVYADHLYGNYDKNTKSLLQKSLVGSVFLQFKTFQLGQFLQDVRGKGNINITTLHHMTTEDGKKLYKRMFKPEEIAKFGKTYEIVTEDEFKNASPEEVEYYSPFLMFTGAPVIGRMYSDFKSAYDIIFHKDVFLENWAHSDVYKANLYSSLFNNLGMLIIAMLLRLLYGEDTVEHPDEQSWWTRWTYTVLMGVAKDGPIDQSISGLLNGTPPSIAILQSFYRNAYNIWSGQDPALLGFMKMFGATRTFAGAVSQ